MTALARAQPWISDDEYLAWEAAQEERFEYFEGIVYAMAEASPNHGRISLNLAGALRDQLRGKSCEAFMETMKVKIPPLFGTGYLYPDVVVVCDPADKAGSIFENPTVVFEVLSPSTEQFNERAKTPAYMHLPAVQFYGVVRQDRMSITVRRRAAKGWEMEEFTDPQARFPISAIGCELTLAEIYERVVWPAPSETA